MYQILMVRCADQKAHVLFKNIAKAADAIGIVEKFNKINEYTAKATGEAVKFVYLIRIPQ